MNGNGNGSGVAERSMGYGLRALNWLAGTDLLDRIRVRKQVERALFQGTKRGFRTATAAGRTFKAAQKLGKPARQAAGKPRSLFDVSPDDEQQMFQEAVRDFAEAKVRPAAQEADAERTIPAELLAQASELGVNMLGIPEELGGVMHEQAATTSALVGEALAHGDMGIAYAALAPGAVATAIGHWGSAEQEATYLPSFSGEDAPPAALALLEPRPLFDPLSLTTTARRDGSDWLLDGAKSLVARATECELFLVAAQADELGGPALFVIESGAEGLSVRDEPAMGLRPAATGRLLLEGVRLPGSALLGEGRREDYVECVQRARIAWCSLAVGAAQAVLDYVIPYVNERTAFGEPISNRQAVAFGVSDIGIETNGMRLATYRAASRADQGHDFHREAALARKLCAAKGMEIGSEGVQLLGGHGFVKEHPVERWYRDLRAAGVMEGALLV
ncbi:MAG TPA: acyl-CoA dehydrogenase family protein [Solirubrobacterales bacterium]|nr:acyl-CoA dehydrogenase family protein [Solirubrobacterales bacterium]